jgi:internalin A
LGNGGSVINASFDIPVDITTDNKGNIYVSDHATPCVRRIDRNGIIRNFAGCGTCQYDSIYCGEGDSAISAKFSGASGITTDYKGNVYITTSINNVVLKVDSNNILTRFAGTGYGWGNPNGSPYGNPPYSGDNGLAINAELANPCDVVADAVGNVYIADFANNRVRMVDTNGIITSVVGNGTNGYSGDSGLAINAEICANSITLDKKGNLYIGGNSVIRKVDVNSKIITTVAGNGTQGYSGNSVQAINATLNGYIFGMVFDTIGNLYISDIGNNVIRRIDTSGIIITIAGTGVQSYSGDNGQAINATFNGISGLTFDSNGNLYIADALNSVIRKINNAIALNGIEKITKENNYLIYPNPNNGNFIIKGNISANSKIQLMNGIGQLIYSAKQEHTLSETTINLANLQQGIYILSIIKESGISSQKIIVFK